MSQKPAFYGDDTWEVFNAYKAGTATKDTTADGQLRITINTGEEQIVLLQDPMYQHVSLTLFATKKENESKGDYARRLYMNQSEFPKWTAILNPIKMPWETLLHVLLLQSKLPTPAKADHIFMELGLPGLFTGTCDASENKRNFVIRRFLEYASDLAGETPRRNLIGLLQHALQVCDLKLTIRKSKQAEVLQAAEPTEEERVLFQKWKGELESIPVRDYGIFRKELLGRYMSHFGFVEIKSALEQIQMDLTTRFPKDNEEEYDIDQLTKFFHRMDIKQRNKGRRELIIHTGLVMSCRLEDINRLLMESGCAYLYPYSRDPREIALAEAVAAISDPI